MQAHELTRKHMLAALDCTDVELRAAQARLERVRAEHVDYQQLMEET